MRQYLKMGVPRKGLVTKMTKRSLLAKFRLMASSRCEVPANTGIAVDDGRPADRIPLARAL
jgi:hypothetical protein